MVNTRTDAELAAAVQAAVDAMIPHIREQVREEYRNGAGGSGGNPPPVTIHTWLERFNKQKPRSFEKAVALVDAENWISHMEKIFDVMDCEDAFKTRLAVYKFEGDALAWWKAYKQAKGGDAWVNTLTWAAFKELFFLQFFPRAEQERLKREYHSIRQRANENSCGCARQLRVLREGRIMDSSEQSNQSIRGGGGNNNNNNNSNNNNNYSSGNNRSSGAGHDQRNRGQQFHRSTSSDSQQSRVPSEGYTHPVCATCGRRHPGECRRASGTCFKCGQAGHLQRDCKKNIGAGTSGHANKKPDASGRVFALTQDQAANTSGTITGTLFIFGRAVFVLFDTGATHSVISTTFASCFTMTPVLLDHVLCISTPLKDSARITHVYGDLPLQFDDKIRSVNALPLDMCEFDMILGIDWLGFNWRAKFDVYVVLSFGTPLSLMSGTVFLGLWGLGYQGLGVGWFGVGWGNHGVVMWGTGRDRSALNVSRVRVEGKGKVRWYARGGDGFFRTCLRKWRQSGGGMCGTWEPCPLYIVASGGYSPEGRVGSYEVHLVYMLSRSMVCWLVCAYKSHTLVLCWVWVVMEVESGDGRWWVGGVSGKWLWDGMQGRSVVMEGLGGWEWRKVDGAWGAIACEVLSGGLTGGVSVVSDLGQGKVHYLATKWGTLGVWFRKQFSALRRIACRDFYCAWEFLNRVGRVLRSLAFVVIRVLGEELDKQVEVGGEISGVVLINLIPGRNFF
ncbi:putative reverse transcriptase domain-containing protein [Tanacetum coccineum]